MPEDNQIKYTIDELKKILESQSFIGDPIETDDKILIPITKMGFSFASASGHKTNNTKNGSGAIAGVEPVAMVVVSKHTEGPDGIRVLDISHGNETSRILSNLGLAATDIIQELIGKRKEPNEYRDVDITEPQKEEENTKK